MNTAGVSGSWRRRAATLTATAVLVSSGVAAVGWLAVEPTPARAQEPATGEKLVADTEAEAARKADKTGEPVEVMALRGERREVHANPDGTMTAIEHTQPVRTVKNGKWVRLDATLKRLPDGSVTPAAATLDMVFSGGGKAPLATVVKAGKRVSLGWDGRLPKPTLDGATATYREVLPGVDLVVTAAVDGFSHVLVVKTAKAAAHPALAKIDMPVEVEGAKLRTTSSGGVRVVDAAAGGVMLAADAPTMWDSSQASRSGDAADGQPGDGAQTRADPTSKGADRADVGVSMDAKSITLTPDPQLLKGPETVYPVFIDPVWRDEYRTAWAMVDSGYDFEEYWKFDGRADEGLGLCPVSSGTCQNSQKKRLFYRMSSSFYEGKDILEATFGATLRHNYDSANTADEADLYLMNKGISTATNWDNQPSGTYVDSANTPAPSGGDCSYSGDHATEWTVTSRVTAAANAGTNTLTFGLRNASETDSTKWMRFCPNGHLRVNYNTPPSQPKMEHLGMDGGAGCSYDLLPTSYVNKLPKLTAVLFDSDHGKDNEWGPGGTVSEQLKPRFKLVWGVNDAETWESDLSLVNAKASGSKFELNLATQAGLPVLPVNTPIGWIVQANDGKTDGPWSWDGSPTRCRFVIDPEAPDPPTITSTDFPDDGSWTEGVGEPGVFTFSSTSPDVASFRYQFSTEAAPRVVPAAADGTASVRYMPSETQPHTLTVEALDNAGNAAAADSYTFNVSAPPAAGSWTLNDAAGASQAADAAGGNPASAGAGVTFGVNGQGANTAAHLDGSPQAYLSAPTRGTVDTSYGFSASAWVRVDDLSHDRTAVSVNGLGEAGFVLGYHAATQEWVFEIPDYDLRRFGQWRITGGTVEVGEWAHLVGVYNAEDSTMRLYVNGKAVTDSTTGAEHVVRQSTWAATGGVEIGRSYQAGHYANNWSGDLAEVNVFDWVVPEAEAQALGVMAPQRQAYWQLNEAAEGLSPEYDGVAEPLALSGGASIYTPDPSDPFAEQALVGAGHLQLDGLDDCASTTSPVVDTTGSFTFTTRVRLAAAQPASSMTVLSIPGVNTDLLTLRYSAAAGKWELSIAHADTVGAQRTTVLSAIPPSADQSGQFLAVVHNAFNDEISLYVDGTMGASTDSAPFRDVWSSAAGIQLGQVTAGEHFSGVIDDVRAYQGVTDMTALQKLSLPNEQPDL